MDKEAELFHRLIADQAQGNCMRFIPEACSHSHLVDIFKTG